MSNSAPSGSTAATRDERFDILADASRRAVPRSSGSDRPRESRKALLRSGSRGSNIGYPDRCGLRGRAPAGTRRVSSPSCRNSWLPASSRKPTTDRSFRPSSRPSTTPSRADRFGEPRCRSGDARCGVPRTRRRTPADGPVGTERSIPSHRDRNARSRCRGSRSRDDRPGGSRDRIDDIEGLTRACPPSLLADATLIGYDDETGRVSYEGNPAVRAEWIQPADDVTTTDDAAADGTATTSTDVRTLEGCRPEFSR